MDKLDREHNLRDKGILSITKSKPLNLFQELGSYLNEGKGNDLLLKKMQTGIHEPECHATDSNVEQIRRH